MTGAWKTKENQTQVSLRFPQPLEIATRFPHFHSPDHSSLAQKNTPRKEALRRIASLPPSGSFFNEKMLSCPQVFDYKRCGSPSWMLIEPS